MEISQKYAEILRTLERSTFLVLGSGRLKALLSPLRIMICALFLLSTSVCMFEKEAPQDQYITMLHDTLGLLSFLLIDLCFFLNRNRVGSIIEALTEKFDSHQQNSHTSEIVLRYTKDLKRCILVTQVMEIVGLAWGLTSFFLSKSPTGAKNQRYVHLVIGWVWESEYTTYFVILNLLYSWTIVTTIFQWTLLMLSIVMKVKCKIRIICADLDAINESIKPSEVVSDSNDSNVTPQQATLTEKSGEDGHLERDAEKTGPHESHVLKILVDIIHKKYNSGRKSEEEIGKYIGNIVDQHIEIIKYVKLTDKTFRWFVWVVAQMGALAAGLVLPKVNLNEHLTPQAVAKVIEALNILLATGVCNVFGQMLLNESETLSRALYSCDWTDKTLSLRRGLLIMQIVAAKPLKLTIGGIYTLGMETYGNILQAIYSYTTFIQGLK